MTSPALTADAGSDDDGRVLQLPTSLPTDNFYKFGTILGIVVVISGVYLSRLDQMEIVARSDALRSAATQPLTDDDPRVQKLSRDFKNAQTFWPWFSAVGALISGGSMWLWWSRHQKLQDELLRLQVEAERQKAKDLLK